MIKEWIKEAATVEEAKKAIAAELGMTEEEIQFEVLQEPQKKTLGLFGGCEAKVRGFVEVTPAATAAAYLKQLLAHMGAGETTIAIEETENGCALRLDGEDLGFIIGRRGDTLDALQYLTGLVANRVDNAYYRVTIDIGNYREKREQALAGLARKIAGQAARTGRQTSLEPMNPYERRIIHTAVQEIKGATSWSTGSEPNRHVVIGPSDDNPNKGRASRGNGRRGGRAKSEDKGEKSDWTPRASRSPRGDRSDIAVDRPVRQFVPRSNPLPVADGATPPSKTASEKEEHASLYGRIDL